MSNTSAFLTGERNLMESGRAGSFSPNSSTSEILTASGLDFEIKTTPVTYHAGDHGEVSSSNRVVHYNNKDGSQLGITAPDFKIVQPEQALEVYKRLTDFPIVSAGFMNGTIWAIARCPEGIKINGDQIAAELLFSTKNDGTSATTIVKNAERLACTNQFQMASRRAGGKDSYRISHRQFFQPLEAIRQLDLAGNIVEEYAESMQTYIDQAMTDRQVLEFFVEVFAKRDAKQNITNEKQVEKIVGKVFQSYKHAPGQDLITARGTAWGAINGITHYVDHVRPTRSTGSLTQEQSRFHAANFGTGNAIKDKAASILELQIDGQVIEVAQEVATGSDDDFLRLLQRNM